MDLWQWAVVFLGVLILLAAVVYGIQARRRRGSVVAQRSRSGSGSSGPRGGGAPGGQL
ncbi:hypothetical protein [Kineosporia babensis]|uniref:Uncharacterized protein n=1 Tax=Kineosporia babensis TaxID=499548 RepID=A0A9X1NK21_9ACTN|nr:hypothetical protein [Kineosporia babensis]MCD5314616.1 hypothetical protein [Kineosporia babensis]